MRGLISTTALAATALLLAGCERKADPANDSVNASLSAPTNGVDPGNDVKASDANASDDKGSDDRGSDDRGSDDRGSDDRGSDDR